MTSIQALDFSSTEKVCRTPNPTEWTSENRQCMVDACREIATYHFENSKEINAIYQKKNFSPSSIKTAGDLEKIPAVSVSAMKYFLMSSRPKEKAVLKLTSSGTKGQKTQIWFDQESLDRVQKMLDVLLDDEGLVSDQPSNYLLFNYDPEEAKNLGTAFTAKNQTRFAPAKRIEYAIKKSSSGEWDFDKTRSFEILKSYEKEGLPVRIKGMPAFIFEFLNYLIDNELELKLAPGSILMTGGGWKAAEDKAVSREALRRMITQKMNIADEKIRDGFGMAEHSAPYFECREHRLHIPSFNHLIIRDPETLKPLPPGEIGILELISPYNTMMPNLAILSTDWASIDSEACPCGKNSPTFQLHGRAGLSKHAGCALTAENIIKRSRS